MKANIVRELENSLIKRKQSNEKNDVLIEVKQLIENDGQRDLHLLRSIGQASTLAQSETEKGTLLELEKKEQFYSGKIFRKEHIIDLAVKYRLKFLQSQHYTKYIDPSIVPEIRDMERSISESMTKERAIRENMTHEEFLQKNGGGIKFTIDDYALKTNFYILAPANCFKTEKTKVFTIKQPDPIMFYSDDNVHFRLIKKWGSDFTILRRIKGFLTKSLFNHVFFVYMLPWTLIAASLFTFVDYKCAFMMAPVLVFALVFWLGGIEVDDEFAGSAYPTSLKSYYV